MMQLQAIARYVVPEENRDQVLGLLRELAAQSRLEPGNISFDIYENVDDPSRVVLLERYKSREAFALHRETPHFHFLVLGKIVPLLTERIVEELDVADA
jgi:quinol monooxygenase YgiN